MVLALSKAKGQDLDTPLLIPRMEDRGLKTFSSPMSWYVYIIECKDNKLYTGITNNLERRIKQHNSGNGCRFTKYRTPVELIYNQKLRTKPQALKREIAIKRLKRAQKLNLIEETNWKERKY